MTLYFEIGPLQEREFTGVSVVAEQLAIQLLDQLGDRVRFFLGDAVAPRVIVEDVLAVRSGTHLRPIVQSLPVRRAPLDPTQFSYGLFPNQKTIIGAFSAEAQVVHDFSTVLTPEFHQLETVALHAPAYRREIWSNDTTFCVSQATADDCALYFDAAARTEIKVLVEGAAWDARFEGMASSFAYDGRKPFVLVLATLEPRKNIDALLAAISERPDYLDAYDFVFVGRAGWGEGVREKLSRYGLAEDGGSSLLFPGFVTEFAKYMLLKQAQLVVYPSWFEGFGLPVLEALSLGRHVLTSMSSSISEVGGDTCFYFDPNFPESFAPAFEDALEASAAERENAAGRRRAMSFTWKKCAATIVEDYQRRAASHGAGG